MSASKNLFFLEVGILHGLPMELPTRFIKNPNWLPESPALSPSHLRHLSLPHLSLSSPTESHSLVLVIKCQT